jgi:hypothetical protein
MNSQILEEINRALSALETLKRLHGAQPVTSSAAAASGGDPPKPAQASSPLNASEIGQTIRKVLNESDSLLRAEAAQKQLEYTKLRIDNDKAERMGRAYPLITGTVLIGVAFVFCANGFRAAPNDPKWQALVILGLAFCWSLVAIVCLHLAFQRSEE